MSYGHLLAPPPVLAALQGAYVLLNRETDPVKRRHLETLIYWAKRGSGKAVGEIEEMICIPPGPWA
jgi:hypothetical protein